MLLGFLGPEGSFSHEVALKLQQAGGVEIRPFPEIGAVLAALERAEIDHSLVPIENSIEGPVNVTLDFLAENDGIYVQREILWPVRQTLLVTPGFRGSLQEIYSHPQSLGQCRKNLARLYPEARLIPVASNALAAQMVSELGPGLGALGSASAAEIFGLEVMASDLQDYDQNVTRFVLLGRELAAPASPAKTSIVFSLAEDRPGGLYAVLGEFARTGLNLTKIESRPRKEGLGRYNFFIDAEGDCRDPELAEALVAVERQATSYRLLGSYPREKVVVNYPPLTLRVEEGAS